MPRSSVRCKLVLARPWLCLPLLSRQQLHNSSKNIHSWYRLHVTFIPISKLLDEVLIFLSVDQVLHTIPAKLIITINQCWLKSMTATYISNQPK